MSYKIKETSRFKKHMRTLPDRLGISKQLANLIVNEILDAVDILEETGTLSDDYGYFLHELDREPWRGFMEFHVLDDVLVGYADVSTKNEIRLIGIYNHELLSIGKLG
ncbi:MAG: type II toxin-antitoxin system YafQ family toxin [Streptococcaceae bacterium]|jgi:mRNA interferase YafQ|nr:type II toxin-antitoxin system YafQ family toxin [Streptococcaceae bacterium]